MARRPKVAHSIRISSCRDPRCLAMHVDLYDEDEVNFACAALAVTDLPELTEAMKDLAYEIAANKIED
jgi:hypothetical protein